MTAEQVCGELMRVHEETVGHLKALNPAPASALPGYPPDHTYEPIPKPRRRGRR